jgi:hypothetical protein
MVPPPGRGARALDLLERQATINASQTLQLTVLWSPLRDNVDMVFLNGASVPAMRGVSAATLRCYLDSLGNYGWEPSGVTTSTERIETYYFRQPLPTNYIPSSDDRITKPRPHGS